MMMMSTAVLRFTGSTFGSGGGCLARSSELFSNPQISSSIWRKSFSTVATTDAATQATQRHSVADKMITLNVGGKQFQTLKSTISQNKVLYNHVLRAETNAEYTAGDPIFIDRDPKHFGIILTYLRNKADGLAGASDAAATTSSILKFGRNKSNTSSQSFNYTSSIQLPKDSNQLSELYIESMHYRIKELQDLVCSQQVLTRVFNMFGSNNPLQLAGSAFANMKRLLVLFGGVMTGASTWVYTQANAAQAAMVEGFDDNSVGFWKNQSKLWNDAAKKLSGSVEK